MIAFTPMAFAQKEGQQDITLLGREASFQPGLSRVVDYVTGNIVYVFFSRTNKDIVVEVVDYPQKQSTDSYKQKLESDPNDRR